MTRLCLLLISFYTFGAICVDSETLVSELIQYVGSPEGDDCRTAAFLLAGNLKSKLNQAKADAEANGIVLLDPIYRRRLGQVGMYTLHGVRDPVVALLVHDNPAIILTSSGTVYLAVSSRLPVA